MVTPHRLAAIGTGLITAAVISTVAAAPADAMPWDIGDKVTKAAESVGKGIAARVVNAILYALIALMKYVMSFFDAKKTNVDGDAFTKMIAWAGDYTYQLQSAFLLFSIIVVASRFAVAQWTGGGENAVTQGVTVSIRALATSIGAGTVVILLAKISDIFAHWIYADTGDHVNKVTDEIKKKVGTIDSNHFDGSSLLLVIIAIMAVFGCLDLLIQLFLRVFYLTFGTAMLPVAAASSGTEGGASTYSQIMKLMVAMLAFKPICAAAFALGMSYTQTLNGTANAQDVFLAILFYVAPILCLPTLLSLVGVGGSMSGKMSGIAGAAALIGGAKVGGRVGKMLGAGAAKSAGVGASGAKKAYGAAKGQWGGGGGGAPSGAAAVSAPRRTNAAVTMPAPGGRSAASSSSGTTGGVPRSGQNGAGGKESKGTPRSSGQNTSTANGTGTSTASGQRPGNGSGRDTAATAASDANPGGRHAQSATATPRSDRTSSAAQTPRNPARPATVGQQRAAAGDRRATARSTARRNLGTNYIGRNG